MIKWTGKKDVLCYFVLLVVLCSHVQAFHKDHLNRKIPHVQGSGFKFVGQDDVHVIIPKLEQEGSKGLVASASEDDDPTVAGRQPPKERETVVKRPSQEKEKTVQKSAEVAQPKKVENPAITSTSEPATESSGGSNKVESAEDTQKKSSEEPSNGTSASTKADDKPTTVGTSGAESNATEAPTTTTEAVTVPTTSSTTTSKPLVEKESHPKDLYCLCDLHINVCDMNCCCDADCNEEDKALFSKCEDGLGLHDTRSYERRQRSCLQHFVFLKHYEVNSLQRTEKGMLCIFRDNNKGDNELPAEKVGELRERILKGTLNIQRKYEWIKKSDEKYKKEPYKYGSPIVGLKTSLEPADRRKPIPFGLPFPYHGESCSLYQPVLFLQDFRSKCKYPLGNLSLSCEVVSPLDGNYFLQSLDIIANPGDDQYESVSVVRSKSCTGGHCTTEPSQELTAGDFPSPTLDGRLCQDVLVSLNLTILHAGASGLVEIRASGEFRDIPLDQISLLQEYQVSFKWAGEAEDNSTLNGNATTTSPTENDYPRSGNPGYLVGKPVIMGRKVAVPQPISNETKSDEFEKVKVKMEDRIEVWKDSLWLTIHSPGICSPRPLQTSRVPTLFDYSHSTACSLNISAFKYCEDLQEEVAKVLVGTEDYLTFEKGLWYVAAYGNSNPEVPTEWIPVSFKNFPISTYEKGTPKTLISKGCDGISSILHIRVAYAFVGSLDFPQARITGVLFEIGDSAPLEGGGMSEEVCTQGAPCPTDSRRSRDLVVATTVTFKDVTAPPVTRVARWPVLTVRLPADFFYPFSSPSSGNRIGVVFASLLAQLIISLASVL